MRHPFRQLSDALVSETRLAGILLTRRSNPTVLQKCCRKVTLVACQTAVLNFGNYQVQLMGIYEA